MIGKRTASTMIAAAFAAVLCGPARAQAPGQARASGRGPTAADFAALKQRVEQQNELIMKLTQLEGEHYEFLLKLLQNNGRAGGVSLPHASASLPPSAAAPPSAPVEPDGVPSGRPRLATITGHVDVKGKPWGPIYVYVENIKEPAVDRNVEITQRDRAFVPSVLLVQRGTRVSFPNSDPFLHNVFSPSPTQPFDLGSYRQGEKAGAVRLFTPGVVEVLCNMHAKMRANVLVVPNRYHGKVNADGSFRLENVPIGARQLVAWTPDAHPLSQSIALGANGASVNFALQIETAPPPIDKMGKVRAPYRSDE